MVIEFAGMHAHGVDVLDRTDDDAVVVLVANDLHFELFPAEHQFFDQHLGRGRRVETALDYLHELGLVEGDTAAGAGKREGRANDRRQSDVFQCLERLDETFGDIAPLAVALVAGPLNLKGLDCALFLRRRQVLRCDLGDRGSAQVAVGFLEIGRIGERRLRYLQPDLLHRLAE